MKKLSKGWIWSLIKDFASGPSLIKGEITKSRIFQPLFNIVQWPSIYNFTLYYITDLLLTFTISRIHLFIYYYITQTWYSNTFCRQPHLLSTDNTVLRIVANVINEEWPTLHHNLFLCHFVSITCSSQFDCANVVVVITLVVWSLFALCFFCVERSNSNWPSWAMHLNQLNLIQ